MTNFILRNMSIQCIKAGADVGLAFSDDLYMTINGQRFSFLNLNENAPSDEGGGFLPGQFGSALSGSGAIFSDSAVIKLFDRDDPDVDGFTGIFEGGDDFITSVLVPTPAQPSSHLIFNLEENGSSYHIEADAVIPKTVVLKLRRGKVASESGGVMNGSNTTGTLVGLGGKDVINAKNGNDIVLGGNNNDILNGGNGDDILFGGKGKDILKGDAGADVFVVAPKTGFDLIKDFRNGEDLIGLGGNLSFQDLTFVQQAKGTLMKAGSEKLAFLQGASANQLTAIDFTQVNLSDLNANAKALLASTR
ncbi:MAG TPA: hypothetical protein V6C57_25915 [Coleofasciculaceae cyanobacterium]